MALIVLLTQSPCLIPCPHILTKFFEYHMNRLLRSGKYFIHFLFLIFFVGIIHFALLNLTLQNVLRQQKGRLLIYVVHSMAL